MKNDLCVKRGSESERVKEKVGEREWERERGRVGEGEWERGGNISEVGFATSTRSVEKVSNYFIWGVSKFACTLYNGHTLPQMYLSVILEGMYTYVQCIHCTKLACTLYNGHTYTLYTVQIYVLIMWVYTHMYSAYTVQKMYVSVMLVCIYTYVHCINCTKFTCT